MSLSRIGIVLMSTGAVVTVLGAAMYVLPGPGLPALSLGLLLLASGAAMRAIGGHRQGSRWRGRA
ncbi:hypothetical protein SUDANB106_04266 [Streptomyces sp. enrichment culture]